MNDFETVIGLEIHAELATESKVFCSCTTEFGGEPNTHCCPVCTGMPGTLPVLNRKALELAISAGLALGCTVAKHCSFDRKNYFYPDLPKAYQITQFYSPVCTDGAVFIDTECGEKRRVGISDLHLEEDAGKLIHDNSSGKSLCDYNRCGVPLVEIVSKPDMRSADEAVRYMKYVKSVLKYIGASDCRMQEGSLRADVNVSVRPLGCEDYGTRTEIKNMNSFKAISRAIEYEARRQKELILSGGSVTQETLRWDDSAEITLPMRDKEDTSDYRYFPEPDIPAVDISADEVERLRAALPELPDKKMERYASIPEITETDAQLLSAERPIAELFEKCIGEGLPPREVCGWVLGDTLAMMSERTVQSDDIPFEPEKLCEVLRLMLCGRISRPVAREVFRQVFFSGCEPLEYIEKNGLFAAGDDETAKCVDEIIADNPKAVNDYLAGETKSIQFLTGQVMRKLRGKAQPAAVIELLRARLDS